MANQTSEPLSVDTEADEHASEFAETLEKLASGDIEISDSEQPEFADIIDEEEVKSAKLAQMIGGIIIVMLWLIIEGSKF